MSGNNAEAQAVLIVPACEKGRGGGHLSRCLYVLRALEESGHETYLWIAEEQKEDVFNRFRNFFEHSEFSRGFHARLLSSKADLAKRKWEYIVLDYFQTPSKDFEFWRSLGLIVGIDEGGPCRKDFNFLLDLLPSLSSIEANLSVPALLPLPRKRRAPNASIYNPLRILVSFGAEDSSKLGFLAAKALARRPVQKESAPEITLIDPEGALSGRKVKKLSNVKVIGAVPNLKEELVGYDLLITHFGVGAFEAIYARLPVLLVSPTEYHENLSRNAGFYSLGVGDKAVHRLESLRINKDLFKALVARGTKIARRYGLERDQKEDLGTFLGGIAPFSPGSCPLCANNEPSHGAATRGAASPVFARFGEESYRRCPRCGSINLSRLKPPPIEYGSDYFFDSYKKQYGVTYLEDFPNLMEMGQKRLIHIRKLLKLPDLSEDEPQDRKDTRVGLKRLKPSLLDIGCAYGPFMAAAAESGFTPVGIDPAEDAVGYVTDVLKFTAWHGFFPNALPVQAQSIRYDAVTLWYVIEHFLEPGKALREIYNILKDGGVLAFSTPSLSGISGRKNLRTFLKNSPMDHYTIWRPASCKKILSKYGFRLKKIVITGHHPERFPLLGALAERSRNWLIYRLLLFFSRVFKLGDTFEVYAVKK